MHACVHTHHRALYRALSHRLLAQAHWEKGDHGVAIGLIGQAQALLKPRADATSAGLPAIDRSKVCVRACVRLGRRPLLLVNRTKTQPAHSTPCDTPSS